jgi:hypothetical protein
VASDSAVLNIRASCAEHLVRGARVHAERLLLLDELCSAERLKKRLVSA